MNSTLAELSAKVLAARLIDLEDVKKLRRGLFSEEQIVDHIFDEEIIDRDEAEMLFAINDAVSRGHCHESWRELFVEAITSHTLKDEMSAGALDADEAQFIISRIEKDGKIDLAELELVVNVSASVTSAPEFFHEYVLAALRKDVLETGSVDEARSSRIRRVIFGPGSRSGKEIDQSEISWLRQIDEVTKDKGNHSTWDILKRELEIF